MTLTELSIIYILLLIMFLIALYLKILEVKLSQTNKEESYIDSNQSKEE